MNWVADTFPWDDHLAPDGRVMEMLSEHQCQGCLEDYLLTGRHGFFSRYEAFIHIIDAMFSEHAKWSKVCNHISWQQPIASLNYLLLGSQAAYGKQATRDKLIEQSIARYGNDMPEITGWRWGQETTSTGVRSTEADV